MLSLERLCHIVDKNMVEVITSEVSVAVGRFNLEYAIAQLKDRDIESTTTEVINRGTDETCRVQAAALMSSACGRSTLFRKAGTRHRPVPYVEEVIVFDAAAAAGGAARGAVAACAP